MSEKLQNLLFLKIPNNVINPFLDVNSEEIEVAEKELLLIQNDNELRPKFKKSYQDFWLQKKIYCYPVL